MLERIHLSPPDVGPRERELLLDAYNSNWIAPLGPHVDGFEADFVDHLEGRRAACALSSGTAALHLALQLVGVEAGSEVLVPTLTFCATAHAVSYLGAEPVLVDSDPKTWNLDPGLVADELDRLAAAGRLPSAVLAVDLYGQCADYDPLAAACQDHGVPLVADAAESLGATYKGRPAGTQTELAAFSFNGNKIITTSGGGMLVGSEEAMARARYLATQARQPMLHYEHTEIGYNYRLSNLLAAIGRGQLESLPGKVERCRAINRRYRAELADLPLSFMPEADHGQANCWLTVALLDPSAPVSPTEVCQHLAEHNIEARPAWKPMHLQPVYAKARRVGGAVAEQIFARGICLPSGSSMDESAQGRVIEAVRGLLTAPVG